MMGSKKINLIIFKGHCFGDQYLKAENRTKVLDSEYAMAGDGVLAILSFSNLFKVFWGRILIS